MFGNNNEEINMNYFEKIYTMKFKFIQHFGFKPTYLVINEKDYEELELECIERLRYIKDTKDELLGTTILGMNVIRSNDVQNIKIGLLQHVAV